MKAAQRAPFFCVQKCIKELTTMTIELQEAPVATLRGFAALGLSEPTLRALADLGYEEPTPIQNQTIMRLTAGADVIAQAQTGTGKTAAFALPMLEMIDEAIRTTQAIVLAPTRELAVQVAEACQEYGKYHRVSVLPIYGGQPIDRQLRALSRGVQIVVGTPGRVLDHLERGSLDLSHIRMVVLDEADEMLDMGFIEDIESILSRTPAERQTALFSATMPAPIAQIAEKYMRNPERVITATRQMTVPQISQVYIEVGNRDKFEVLARMLDFETPTSTIIFCRTKHDVDTLGERLTARGYPAETLHGDLSQLQRDRVMARFRTGQVELLVATDVAARGLDIDHVSHVINYDLPIDPEVYVHRIGRTGRAGRTGNAITLVSSRDRRLLKTITNATRSPIERIRVPSLVDVVARRREKFKITLREAINAGGFEAFTSMVGELSDEFNTETLAAAVLKLMLGKQLEAGHDQLAAHEPETAEERRGRMVKDGPRDDRRDRRDRRDEPRNRDDRRSDDRREPRAQGGRFAGRERSERSYDDRNMVRLFLDIGRIDAVRPADIVGAIANEAGISGRAIGAIELFERHSSVDVPAGAADQIVRSLRNTTIRGRRVLPSREAQRKTSRSRSMGR
jgi:ATP-dependent RNA helicase DeaD